MLAIKILKVILAFSFIAMHLSNIFLLRKLRKKSSYIRKRDSVLLILLVILFIAIFVLSVTCDFAIHQKSFTAGKLIFGLIVAYLQIIPAVYTVCRLQKHLKGNSTV